MSKIRASFVAVEKSGQMGPILGLRKVSDDHSAPEPKLDGSVDARSHESRHSFGRAESNAGSTRETIEEETLDSGVGNKIDDKAGSEVKMTTPEKGQRTTTKPELESLDEQKEDDPATVVKSNGTASSSKTTEIGKGMGKEAAQKDNNKRVPEAKPSANKMRTQAPKTTTTTTAKRQPAVPKTLPDRTKAEPSTLSSTTASQSKLKQKHSTASIRSTTSTTSKAKADQNSSSTAKTPTTSQPKPPNIKTDTIPKASSKVSTPRTSLASATSKEVPKNAKAKPKSPTKPQRLPASATAQTASSAAKTAPERPTSRDTSKPTPSTDNSFLARMMRPTASSASKTHEKVAPTTPPRTAEATKQKKKSEGPETKGLGHSPRPKTVYKKVTALTKSEPSTPTKSDTEEAATVEEQDQHPGGFEHNEGVKAEHSTSSAGQSEQAEPVKEKPDEQISKRQDLSENVHEEQPSPSATSMEIPTEIKVEQSQKSTKSSEPTVPIKMKEPDEGSKPEKTETLPLANESQSPTKPTATAQEQPHSEAPFIQKQEEIQEKPRENLVLETKPQADTNEGVEEVVDDVAPHTDATESAAIEPHAPEVEDESTGHERPEDTTANALEGNKMPAHPEQQSGEHDDAKGITQNKAESHAAEQSADLHETTGETVRNEAEPISAEQSADLPSITEDTAEVKAEPTTS